MPAIIDDKSSENTFFPRRVSGTSPDTIFCAKPSATAVLPTPGSPIRHGLFFVLLDKICITLSISLSLPIIGSIPPSAATFVKSVPNCVRFLRLSFPPLAPSLDGAANISLTAVLGSKFISDKILAARLSPSFKIAKRMCSQPIYIAPKRADSE